MATKHIQKQALRSEGVAGGKKSREKKEAQKGTQVQRVTHEIRTSIAKRELKPGDMILEGVWAEKLNLSRQPIREALAILDNEGLIERLPRYGSRVRVTSPDDVREILTLRTVMESLVASELAQQSPAVRDASMEQIERILRTADEECKKARAAQATDDKDGMSDAAAAFVAGDDNFHAYLAELAGYRLWAGISKTFRHKLLIHHVRYLPSVTNMEKICDEHKHIVEAIKAGDPGKAKEETINHIRHVASRYFPAAVAHLGKVQSFVGVEDEKESSHPAKKGSRT